MNSGGQKFRIIICDRVPQAPPQVLRNLWMAPNLCYHGADGSGGTVRRVRGIFSFGAGRYGEYEVPVRGI